MSFSTTRLSILNKSGFTIREILVIIIIISVGLLSVVVVLTHGMTYVQKTRQKVIALNLAREGMEAVYQIRDTNRTHRALVKDKCWLDINPLLTRVGRSCSSVRFTSGSYVLQRLIAGGQSYFALTGPLSPLDISNGLDSGDWKYSLCQQSGYWDACIGFSGTTSEGIYFRQIEGLGLYLKDEPITGGSLIECTGGMLPDCGNARAKEFHFCSRVVYVSDSTGEVKLCGVITNFEGNILFY